MVEQRKYPRQILENATIDIAGNLHAACGCNIVDVSAGGLLSGNIPSRLVIDNNVFTKNIKLNAIIQLNHQFLKLKVAPRWFNSECRSYFKVGFEIIGNPEKWFEFVRMQTNTIPKHHEDLWGIGGQKYLR